MQRISVGYSSASRVACIEHRCGLSVGLVTFVAMESIDVRSVVSVSIEPAKHQFEPPV
jgi:hypothetical protein